MRYDLKRMLEEITRDEKVGAGDTQRVLTQDEIRQLAKSKRATKKVRTLQEGQQR